jgi:hypothetical protein
MIRPRPDDQEAIKALMKRLREIPLPAPRYTWKERV